MLAGWVHDLVVLFASVRHKGKSLSVIAESEIGRVAGKVASVAILFILILTLAGLSIAVVNAMFDSPWGTFTVFATMPIAMLMGIYMQKIRPGDIRSGSIIGVVLLALSIYAGPFVAADPTLAALFTFSKKQLALIATCVLLPAEYFAINAAPAAYAKLGLTPVNLPELAAEVGEQVQGRPGGAVSLAVGMAYIFSSLTFMKGMMAYWYHFAIMFEAVFILTAVDAGTRVGRYLLQEMLGKVYAPFADNSWTPGILPTSALFTSAWGYLVYTGDISIIWPLFGMSNQHLATCALIVGTTMLIRLGDRRARPVHDADLHLGRVSQYYAELSAQETLSSGEPVRHPDGADDDRLCRGVPALACPAAD